MLGVSESGNVYNICDNGNSGNNGNTRHTGQNLNLWHKHRTCLFYFNNQVLKRFFQMFQGVHEQVDLKRQQVIAGNGSDFFTGFLPEDILLGKRVEVFLL